MGRDGSNNSGGIRQDRLIFFPAEMERWVKYESLKAEELSENIQPQRVSFVSSIPSCLPAEPELTTKRAPNLVASHR